jgi:hypothetical protein
MRRRACADLCGGRSAMVVPTATSTPCCTDIRRDQCIGLMETRHSAIGGQGTLTFAWADKWHPSHYGRGAGLSADDRPSWRQGRAHSGHPDGRKSESGRREDAPAVLLDDFRGDEVQRAAHDGSQGGRLAGVCGSADGRNRVYLEGGRHWRLADAYLGTLTLKKIFGVLDRGGVVMGGSAGATIQGCIWCAALRTRMTTRS